MLPRGTSLRAPHPRGYRRQPPPADGSVQLRSKLRPWPADTLIAMRAANRRDSFPLREIVTILLGSAGQSWLVREDNRWCHITPADYPMRVQGWKLHVSATWLSAPIV